MRSWWSAVPGRRRLACSACEDALAAYKSSPLRQSRKRSPPQPLQNWLPAVAAITLAAVLIVSGLVFWQRSRRSGLGIEAYRTGRETAGPGTGRSSRLGISNRSGARPAGRQITGRVGPRPGSVGSVQRRFVVSVRRGQGRSAERSRLVGAGRDRARRGRQETGASTLRAVPLQGMARIGGAPSIAALN